MRLTPIRDATDAELRALFLVVFAGPPWNEDEAGADAFVARLATERAAPGFDGVVARRGDTPVGMAYGLTTPTPFPADRAYPRVAAALGGDASRLTGTFELMELATTPGARGTGAGAAMLNAVVGARAAVWLLTIAAAEPAMRLYGRAGLAELGRDRDLVVWGRGV